MFLKANHQTRFQDLLLVAKQLLSPSPVASCFDLVAQVVSLRKQPHGDPFQQLDRLHKLHAPSLLLPLLPPLFTMPSLLTQTVLHLMPVTSPHPQLAGPVLPHRHLPRPQLLQLLYHPNLKPKPSTTSTRRMTTS